MISFLMLRRCGGRTVSALVSRSSGMSSSPAEETLLWSFAAKKALNYHNALSRRSIECWLIYYWD